MFETVGTLIDYACKRAMSFLFGWVPSNWWTIHHDDCGTQYRGCHPKKCPKDQYEKTGRWKWRP